MGSSTSSLSRLSDFLANLWGWPAIATLIIAGALITLAVLYHDRRSFRAASAELLREAEAIKSYQQKSRFTTLSHQFDATKPRRNFAGTGDSIRPPSATAQRAAWPYHRSQPGTRRTSHRLLHRRRLVSLWRFRQDEVGEVRLSGGSSSQLALTELQCCQRSGRELRVKL